MTNIKEEVLKELKSMQYKASIIEIIDLTQQKMIEEFKDLQKAYDIAIKEIVLLRKKLGYDKSQVEKGK